VLQDWSVNSSLYARLLLVSFRIGSLRATVAGRLTRLLLGPIYRVTELLFGRILGQAQLDPRATVGPGLRLPHGGNGIVLNASAELGTDVVLFQQVTVGVDPFARGTYRSGRIGDRVVIGAGAKVIGDVRIGDDAVVGTNAVVVEDVPACATAVGVPARVIERDSPLVVNPATGL
jgi:serine O-acetyltransferase